MLRASNAFLCCWAGYDRSRKLNLHEYSKFSNVLFPIEIADFFRVALTSIGNQLAGSREDLPVVRQVHIDALREIPVIDLFVNAG